MSTISSFFQPKSNNVATGTIVATTTSVVATPTETPLTSTDPDISAFYAQLSEQERIAHAIAVVKLGTSYDVVRTHGYLKWMRARKS